MFYLNEVYLLVIQKFLKNKTLDKLYSYGNNILNICSYMDDNDVDQDRK